MPGMQDAWLQQFRNMSGILENVEFQWRGICAVGAKLYAVPHNADYMLECACTATLSGVWLRRSYA